MLKCLSIKDHILKTGANMATLRGIMLVSARLEHLLVDKGIDQECYGHSKGIHAQVFLLLFEHAQRIWPLTLVCSEILLYQIACLNKTVAFLGGQRC